MSAAADPLECLTVEEAAAILKVSSETVFRLLKAGELRGRRVGLGPRAPWRVTRRALDEFLSRGERPAGAVVQMRSGR